MAVRLKPYIAPPFYPAAKVPGVDGAARRVRAYYQVRDWTCGFASTLTVLHSFRRYVDPAQLYRRLGTDRTGTRQTAIVRELRTEGLTATRRYDLDFDRIAHLVDQGALIIAYHFRLEHWLVVFGCRRDPGRILVADPLPGHRTEHVWDTFGPKLEGFGIVCRPRRRRIARPPLAPLAPQASIALSAASAAPVQVVEPRLIVA
jgi:ABC-type bacteriocin/lantibiotic exporter with double-glycine peptidase domain